MILTTLMIMCFVLTNRCCRLSSLGKLVFTGNLFFPQNKNIILCTLSLCATQHHFKLLLMKSIKGIYILCTIFNIFIFMNILLWIFFFLIYFSKIRNLLTIWALQLNLFEQANCCLLKVKIFIQVQWNLSKPESA